MENGALVEWLDTLGFDAKDRELLPVPGRPTILITVGQGPIALAVGAGGVVWTFLLSSILSFLSPSLWETARYRLKYCLKGPLNSKQPTNQPRIRIPAWVIS